MNRLNSLYKWFKTPFWKLFVSMNNAIALEEWRACKDSDIKPKYDLGDSVWYAASKKHDVPLCDVTKDMLPREHFEREYWVIPKQWLDEQETSTEIKDE